VRNDHFKCLAIAVNGGPVNFALIGVHHVDLKPRRCTPRFRAKKVKNDDGVADADEVFDARGSQFASEAAVARGSDQSFLDVSGRAFRFRLVESHPNDAYEIVRPRRRLK